MASPRFLEQIVHPPPRPSTPTVAAPDPLDSDRTQAAICLQRILRGRAVQIRVGSWRDELRVSGGVA